MLVGGDVLVVVPAHGVGQKAAYVDWQSEGMGGPGTLVGQNVSMLWNVTKSLKSLPDVLARSLLGYISGIQCESPTCPLSPLRAP